MRNEVRMDMLESLGGLESSIKPLEKDLRKHEMRPYDYVRNYGEEIRQMRENPSFVCEGGEAQKILSASPYRASVRVKSQMAINPASQQVQQRMTSSRNCDSEDDFEREGTLTQTHEPCLSPMKSFRRTRTSPIREDSISLRERGDDILY